MKNTSLIINAVLAIAIAVLFVLHFGSKNEATSTTKTGVTTQSSELKVAYIKLDSLLVNYNLAQDLHEDFTQKQEAYNTEFGKKRQEFEKQAVAFQEKLKRGGFLSQELAMRERNRLAGQEQEIKKMDYELSTKLAEIQQKNNLQLIDSVKTHLELYNKSHKFTYIINSSNVLIGDEALNITKEVLTSMNSKYTAKSKK
ncbi:OmpH family outer membrane protein [Prolixibacteraceae bacterium JC049]|nr:OmpH family outer membrane protein [Prolixibacteraceae bacterium JC049]